MVVPVPVLVSNVVTSTPRTLLNSAVPPMTATLPEKTPLRRKSVPCDRTEPSAKYVSVKHW